MTREEAVKILKGAIKKPNTKDGYLGQALDMAIKALEQQPKTGHWIDVEILDSALWHECSECGETEFYATDYCPNCGARMEVEK